MFTIKEIKKALKTKGYTDYEINHTINLIKEMSKGTLDYSKIDNIEFDGIDHSDAPDYCDKLNKNMIWVSIKKRKPKASGYYYWKGKNNYGGRAYYYNDINYFDFDESIPVNKVDEENLYWLDETDAQYEECH